MCSVPWSLHVFCFSCFWFLALFNTGEIEYISSVLLYLCPSIWCIFEKVPWTVEKNMGSTCLVRMLCLWYVHWYIYYQSDLSFGKMWYWSYSLVLCNGAVCSEKLVQLHLLAVSLELAHPSEDDLVRQRRDTLVSCFRFLRNEILCSAFCPKIVLVFNGEVCLLEAGRKGSIQPLSFQFLTGELRPLTFRVVNG